ncbi:MAG: hypothetical protein ACRC9V_02750 [Aeromonas sp.]
MGQVIFQVGGGGSNYKYFFLTKEPFSSFGSFIFAKEPVQNYYFIHLSVTDVYFTDLCDRFMTFFECKVRKIHQQLLSTPNHGSCQFISHPLPHYFLSTFALPNTKEIMSLIGKSKSSTFQLDPYHLL